MAESLAVTSDHSEMPYVKELHVKSFALIFALIFASCDNNTLTIYTDHSEMGKCKGVHENTHYHADSFWIIIFTMTSPRLQFQRSISPILAQ